MSDATDHDNEFAQAELHTHIPDESRAALPRRNPISRAVTTAFVAMIRFYQRFISPLSGPSCRYYPTCSAYGLKSMQVHGPIKGFVLTAWRLLRCNPFTKGGVDPVPPHGYWLPNVLPNGTVRPGREALVAAVVAQQGAEVQSGSGIRHNGSGDIASTSSESDVPTSDAPSLDHAPSVEVTPEAVDTAFDTDGPATAGPRQEHA